MDVTEAVKEYRQLAERFQKATQSYKLYEQYGKDPSDDPDNGSPYIWQADFHNKGALYPERALIAANQVGKTRPCGAEVAQHLTGWYPPWWEGHRFKEPISCIIAGVTNEMLRDHPQKAVFGLSKEGSRELAGNGWVPASSIIDYSFRQCGITGVLDIVRVRHASGGTSICYCKSFEQGAVKFQSGTHDLIWLDEEPENEAWDIFSECKTRLVVRDGLLLLSRTPLFGRSEIITYFLEGGPGIYWKNATWDDAPHMTPEARARQTATYAPHEVETRTKGVPMMGHGAVYPYPDELLLVEPFPIPKHYHRIVGLDFGIDREHPFAACWLLHDTDTDVVYIYDSMKVADQTPVYHADAIKARGLWIPVAWPHDGAAREKGSGVQLASQYLDRGLNMLGFSARFEDNVAGPQSREIGTMNLLERMRTGRLRVFNNAGGHAFLEEKRLMYRKDGIIVARNDHIESAARYGVMMLRCAVADYPMDMNLPKTAGTYDPYADFTTVIR